MNKVLDFLQDNWLPISAVIEAGLRLIPTAKNISIIDNVFKVISFLVKNRRKPQAADAVPANDLSGKVNSVVVDRFKHIIPVILLLCIIGLTAIAPTGAFAQTNSTQKSARFYNADSLTVQTEVTGLDLMYDNVGALYYNDDQDKFRIYYAHEWHDLISSGGGGGGLSTANNGVNVNPAGNVQLGGALVQSTIVDGLGTYNLQLNDFAAATFRSVGTMNISSTGDNVNIKAGNATTGLGVNMDLAGTGPYGTPNSILISSGDWDGQTTDFSYSAFSGLGVEISYGNTTGSSYGNIALNGDLTVQTSNNATILTGDQLSGLAFYMDYDGNSPYGQPNSFFMSAGDWNTSTTDYGYMVLYPNNLELALSNADGSQYFSITAGNGGASIASTDPIEISGDPGVTIEAASGGIDLRLTSALTLNGAAGTAGQVLTSNGTGTSPTWETVSGGLTNIASANEFPLTVDASGNMTHSGVWTGLLGLGDIDFGGTSQSGSQRYLRANGSGSDVGMNFIKKGTASTFTMSSTTAEPSIIYSTGTAAGSGYIEFNTPVTDTTPNAFGIRTSNTGGSQVNGGDLTISTGQGSVSLNGNGGNINILPGVGGGTGHRGYIIMTDLPTACTGLPTGALANVSGVLNVCP